MDKVDLRRQWQHLYKPPAKAIQVIDIPEFSFAVIDGDVAPEESPSASAGFQSAIQALYGITYTLKFTGKKRAADPLDFSIMPLEGLWWGAAGEFDISKRDEWRFQLMIMLPDQITQDMFSEAAQQLALKRGVPVDKRLRLQRLCEGICVQVMHIGPYADEPATIERMRVFAQENGYTYHGQHHEIYLGDPRQGDPQKLKTILRQPVLKG